MINWVTQLSIKEKVKLFNKLYDELAGYGREGDTELAHINPFEAKLLKAVGGSGTINPVTGLREYKGGGGSAPPPPATQTVRQEATIPEELKPFVTDILEESQAQYRQRQEEGYVPYEGAQIAQFTPEQQQAFQATRGIFEQGLAGTPLGQSTTYLAPALGATTASTLPTTAATIGQYMDPYLENVLRVQEQEARRADEISRQNRAAQAVQAGAFGGSREAVMEAEAQRGLEDRLASLRASGMSQAFQTAQQMAEAQRARELQAGRQFAALGETAAQQQAREIGGLAATGEAIRGQRQAGLDIAKTQFMEEQQFPQSQLQQYSSIIRGFPLTPSQLRTSQTVTPQPSLTQQLLGAGVGAAGLAGAFGAFKKEGGLVGLAEGGRPMDAMPMAAMPMNPRSRAADLGSAIGDLAKRMGTGRSMSQIGGGLTSVLSAPAMSQNMQQMMPQQASATPMQMPSQRFMNAGGKVGYYQQGTQQGTLSSTLGMANPMVGPLSGFDYRSVAQVDEAVRQGRLNQLEAMKEKQKLLEEAAEVTPEQAKYLERLKGIDFSKRQKDVEKDFASVSESLDRDKYLAMAKAGLGILSQDGSKGTLGGIASGIISSGALDDIAATAKEERRLAKEKTKELRQISSDELDNLAKVAGITSKQAKEVKAAQINKFSDIIANADRTIADVTGAQERGQAAAKQLADEKEALSDFQAKLATSNASKAEKQTALASRVESLYKTKIGAVQGVKLVKDEDTGAETVIVDDSIYGDPEERAKIANQIQQILDIGMRIGVREGDLVRATEYMTRAIDKVGKDAEFSEIYQSSLPAVPVEQPAGTATKAPPPGFY